MIDLSRLKAAQTQLLLAEVVGLLHNLGKLHGDFLISAAPELERKKYEAEHPGFDYNDQRVDDAVQVIRFRKAEVLIRTEQDRRKLVRSLLNDATLWPGEASIAKDLLREWDQPSRTSRDIKRIARNLRMASRGITDSKTAHRIAEETISALGLAALMQVSGIDRYLDTSIKKWLRNTSLKVLSEQHSLSELLLLFWDDFYWQPSEQIRIAVAEKWVDHTTILPRYLATAHGVVSGVEKGVMSGVEKGVMSGMEKLALIRKEQSFSYVCQATAFGNESLKVTATILDSARETLLGSLVHADLTHHQWRKDVASKPDAHLALALGDTRRPVNDVTLWDYASSVAALFKAAVAKAILEGHFVETSELRWRLLSVRYDGLAFMGQAHHISDLLARKDALEAGLEAVRVLIEVECPLASEIYRDENGSIYVVPYVEEDGRDVDLLSLPVEGDGPLADVMARRFASGAWDAPLDGEVQPVIVLNKALPERPDAELPGEDPPEQPHVGLLGKNIRLPHASAWSNPPLRADPASVEQWWSEEAKRGEVCTVCGLRPQGYGAPEGDWQRHLGEGHRPGQYPAGCRVCKAQDRAICHVCMERRGDRSEAWATKEAEFAGTIWTDEVADDDGRLALIVGRFDLGGWLNGQLIATTQRNDSFGRIRRCWGTTQTFWQQIEGALSALVGGCCRPRLIITPQNGNQLRSRLGPYHAYEMELNGRYLSMVWDPRGEGRLISSENLNHALKTLAIGGLGDLQEHLRSEEQPFSLYEPSAHLTRRERRGLVRVQGVEEQKKAYSPAITLLAEPAVFMALVPGNKALNVAQHIKTKYETEMGKVRDRLPLHLGLVYAPRRTPVRAILEAGRRMLNMRSDWKPWQVASAGQCGSASPHAAGCWAITFDNGVVWHMPLRMGDHSTDDNWYPHILSRPPVDDKEDLGKARPWKHARELVAPDTVYVRPSLFDFEFLDTPARHFEIAYDDTGRRRGSATRPFLLEELDRLEGLWQALVPGEGKRLRNTQLRSLEGMLRGRVTEWYGGNVALASGDDIFHDFARGVLHRLDKSWWRTLNARQRAGLEQAAEDGVLLDLLYLMLHVLKEPKQEQSKENGEGG